LEGKTQDEAARQLGCTPDTVRGRLNRGRAQLQRRLTRRGVTLGAGLFATVLSQGPASASTMLRKATVRAVLKLTAANATGALSAEVISLAEEAMPAIAVAKVRVGIGILLAMIMVAAGAGLLAHQPSATDAQDNNQPAKPIAPTKQIHDDKNQTRVDRF